jgi:hypothetical protein
MRRVCVALFFFFFVANNDTPAVVAQASGGERGEINTAFPPVISVSCFHPFLSSFFCPCA